ncbi:MAG TPA: lysozyme inhibitor LprI family protein [Rubrivivax sp.]|nr:lysozyme inhibitor LprI family protein [Rubrivivax sp.]
MKARECSWARACAVAAAAVLLPAAALAQQPAAGSGAQRAAPPLPERLRTLDEGLKQEHDELLQRVSAEARDQGRLAAALKAQQAAWLQYRDAACALAGMVGDAGAVPTRTMQCKAEWAEAQRMRLWTALDCIAQVPPAERAAEQERCLQALAASLAP